MLGVTGSVGVLTVPYYIKLLRESIAENVHVMMSHSAQKFVTPYTMRLYSGNYVFTNSFDISDDVRVPHIELTRKCNMFVIMPATANIIGKVANGICDDLISTAVMACVAPVVFIPSMNPNMWFSKANQKNVSTLKELGHFVLPPSEGYEVADMKPSFGSMPEFESIVDFLKKIVVNKS
ncbi:MAG TPA: flavoprotein [Candidatus Nitrosotalea sp.]|nr:flavoprotein [Candidatus Nitrosotalea sp.]